MIESEVESFKLLWYSIYVAWCVIVSSYNDDWVDCHPSKCVDRYVFYES